MQHHRLQVFEGAGVYQDAGHAWREGGQEEVALAFQGVRDDGTLEIVFILLNRRTGMLLKQLRLALPPTTVVSRLLLASHAQTGTWGLATLEDDYLGEYRFMLYMLAHRDAGEIALVQTVLLENIPSYEELRIRDLFDLESIETDLWALAYLQGCIEDVCPDRLMVKQIQLESERVQQHVLEYVLRVLFSRENKHLFELATTCSVDVSSQRDGRDQRGINYLWHIALQRRQSLSGPVIWTTPLPMTLPLSISHPLAREYADEHVITTAAMIVADGIVQGKSSYAVGAVMADDAEGRSATNYQIGPKAMIRQKVDTLLVIDEDGQVISHCASPIGLYAQLGSSHQQVVGVDMQENRWRLWKWQPLQERQLASILELAETVRRACIAPCVGQQASDEPSIWVVEEYLDEVHVSKHRLDTLERVDGPVVLTGSHLCTPGHGKETLDWHIYREMAVSDDGLLLLVVDDEAGAVLYRFH